MRLVISGGLSDGNITVIRLTISIGLSDGNTTIVILTANGDLGGCNTIILRPIISCGLANCTITKLWRCINACILTLNYDSNLGGPNAILCERIHCSESSYGCNASKRNVV